MERKSKLTRKTSETDISAELILHTTKESQINSGVPFFDHMLLSMAKHGRFHLRLLCQGDNEVDDHHSVEDIGIAIGQALKDALGDKSGINRFGEAVIPMDETLSMVAMDLSGRPYYQYTGKALSGYIGRYSEELTGEFLRAFATHAGINLHVKVFYGTNKHHIHESIFKALGVALYKATAFDQVIGGRVLSTKGTIV
ncbi:MAG: imidazoleglycerol-phosphate dehydratase HisB [Spirochaetes bacterium]|nr:imidazoleglycerol-phosphate dehydratase HisB [Spirochaetota bacterium]